MKNFIKKIIIMTLLICMMYCAVLPRICFALDSDVAFSVSPMNQKISLEPGEIYYGTFRLTNPASSLLNFYYKTSVTPFYVDEKYSPKFEDNNSDYNQMVDWVVVENDTGVIAPNETVIVRFKIQVPENAPAGGQYAAIKITSAKEDEKQVGINIDADYEIAHLIYADIAGETIRRGTVDEVNVPSFLFFGNISGSATITNIGNVHSDATYKLQIFPLFSGEEIFTNEEDPKKNIIFPGTARSTTIVWDDTPPLGIFHVVFSAEFEGVESKVDKMVIVCPLWLLFIIILAVFLIIFKIWSGKKREK